MEKKSIKNSVSYEYATFGAGCFWGVEETFRKVEGVVDTAVGYEGGKIENPTYEQVCGGDTGHTEVVELSFDPSIISYENILKVFWECHDPTSLNRQGPDVGLQYRSVIFYHTLDQEKIALSSKEIESKKSKYIRPIATSVEPAQKFYRAEEYHQRYLEKRGVNVCH